MKNTEKHPTKSVGLYDPVYGMRILRSLRCIMRAVDIHSRKLDQEFNVTAPQMICLVALSQQNDLTLSQLTKLVNLSPSTLTGILDRLERKQLVLRERSVVDRRKIYLHLTENGRKLTQKAPVLLQDRLSQAVDKLPELEQATMALALEKLVSIMDLNPADASANLIQGTIIEESNTGDVHASKKSTNHLEQGN